MNGRLLVDDFNTGGPSAAAGDPLPAGDPDPRPETSPFATPSMPLALKDGTFLYVPKTLLARIPNISLPEDITSDVGHVLIHYLLTNTYQCLKPTGPSPQERLSYEFETALRVLAIARLPHLSELSHAELTRVGGQLPTPLVFRIVRKAFPENGKKNSWLQAYLKARLDEFLEEPMKPLESEFWNSSRESTHVDNVLFAKLLELRGRDKAPVAEEYAVEETVPEAASYETDLACLSENDNKNNICDAPAVVSHFSWEGEELEEFAPVEEVSKDDTSFAPMTEKEKKRAKKSKKPSVGKKKKAVFDWSSPNPAEL